jgi:hypothetical protein
VAHQPAISTSISSQHQFNRAGGRTSNVRQKMHLIFILVLVATGSLALANGAVTPERVKMPKTLESTVAFYDAGKAGPEHSVFKFADGLWMDVAPLADSTVVNYFGAYPSLSLFQTKIHKLIKSGDAATNENTPTAPGANSSRYLFGQSSRHTIANFQGFSFMAQYTQGPGDHSLKNEDLYWSLYGLIYSPTGERLFVIRAGMAIHHKSLTKKRPYLDGSIELSKEENRVLNGLDKKFFEPSIESALHRLEEIIKIAEQGVAPNDR